MKHAAKKPSVSSTTWTRIYHEGNAKVFGSDEWYDFYKVVIGDNRPKYFFGETAWSDTQRFVLDNIKYPHYTITPIEF